MKDWLEKMPQRIQLANQGDADSQCELGDHYCSFDSTPEKKAEGVMWYRKAADQGFIEALYGLGNCYSFGLGVAKDPIEGYAYWKLIADVYQHARTCLENVARYEPQIIARGEQRAKELLKEYDDKWPTE